MRPKRRFKSDEIFFDVRQETDGGYLACARDLCIFTEAQDLRELEAQVRDAVQCHFQDRRSPKTARLHLERPLSDRVLRL